MSTMSALHKMKERVLDQMARMYQKSMRRKLNAHGLKFDDLRIEENAVVAEAIRRLTPEQQRDRNRRLFRAADISLKRVPLPDHIQAVQQPFDLYLKDKIAEVNAEKEERDMLNSR